MVSTQPVRGTEDWWLLDHHHISWIVEVFRKVTTHYGFEEITTPLLERAALFQETSGDTSDIVSKEMFYVGHKNESDEPETYVLRPEGTAPAVRALWSCGKAQELPVKVTYWGPMFRYGRPQKGRLRQFHHTGLELIGDASAESDAEVISAAYDFLAALGLTGLELRLHTLGDGLTRQAYRQALVDYLTPIAHELSEESQQRLARNPLRLWDSKAPQDQALLQQAPRLTDFLTVEAKAFWDRVQEALQDRNISFVIDPGLVRGLDYYTHTVFEFVDPKLGLTVLGGGRYDGLVERIGGKQGATPGIGWAAGVERLKLITTPPAKTVACVAIVLDDNSYSVAREWIARWRTKGLALDWATHGEVKHRLRYADRRGAPFAILLAENELKEGNVLIRNMVTGTQITVPLADVPEQLGSL